MKISLNWLQEFIELTESDPQKIRQVLTEKSAEVDGVLSPENSYKTVVTGKLLQFEKIKGSDKLHEGKFDLGEKGEKTIIFGSVFPLKEGEIYPIGLAGTILSGGFEIKDTKMLGVKSEGMVCADEELGIHFTSEGLLRFPENTPLGKPVLEILKESLENVVIGKVLKVEQHPNADRLNIATVQIAEDETSEIVCGGVNLREGIKVPVALVGANLWGGFKIKPAKIRDVESNGMICATTELGIGPCGEKEIYILPDNAPEVGTPYFDTVLSGGIVFDIDNTAITNRPDLFSHLGFAREFVALGLAKWKKKEFDFSAVEKNIPSDSLPITFDVKDPEICPARAEVVLENITIAPSPEWMQSRLRECGIRPINNIVDVSNYVMFELGMPLHCFDLDNISGKTITMRESEKGEKVVTLDSKERELPAGVIIQEDDKKIFDLAGIMGGENSEISDSTTRVLVHVPVYDPIRIRKAAIALAHRTDASTIYEKRVPNASALPGALRTVQLILEMCPEAKVTSKVEYVEHIPAEKRSISLPKKMVSRILGSEVSDEKMREILESLDFSVSKNSPISGLSNPPNPSSKPPLTPPYQGENPQGGEDGGDTLLVGVPPHRLQDVTIPEDLAEEIARVYGFNTILAHSPKINIRPAAITPLRQLRRETSDILVGYGFYEALNFAFLGPELLKLCGVIPDEKYVEVANPISIDQSLMRQSLLPRLFETSAENRKHRDYFSLFEIGKTFVKISDEEVSEAMIVSGISCGKDFFELKGILELLFSDMHLPLRFAELKDKSSFAASGAKILIGNNVIGEIAVPKKSIRKTFDLSEKSAYFTLDLSEMAEFPRKHVSVSSAPKFPEIVLDISVLAEKDAFSSDVLRTASKVDPLVVSSEVIEIYEGSDLPEGKKSITLRFVFRASDRTLSHEEGDILRKKILEKLEKKGYPFRFH